MMSKAAGQASTTLITRVRAGLAKRGLVKSDDILVALETIPGPHLAELPTLSLIDLLPNDVTDAHVRRLIESPTFRGSAYQIIAAYYYSIDDTQRLLNKLEVYLSRELSNQTHGRVSPDQVSRYVRELLRLLQIACQKVAAELNRRVRRSTGAVEWAADLAALASLESIDRHLDLLSSTVRPTNEMMDDLIERYRPMFIDWHTKITLPDLTSRKEVDHRKIFVPPTLEWWTPDATAGWGLEPPPKEAAPKGRLWNPELADLLTEHVERAVVLGDPGAGKSTTSAVLAYNWMYNGNGVAFYVRLREVAFDGGGFDVVATISRLLATRYQVSGVDGSLVEALLTMPTTLLVFDGLDEVLSQQRRAVTSKIIETVARRYPFLKMIVTSRKVGYQEGRLDNETFTEYCLSPFTARQTEAYANNWFRLIAGDEPGAAAATTKDLLKQSNGIVDLRSNPLMLALICMIYSGIRSIPRNRVEIYRRCLDLLLHELDASKELRPDLQHLKHYYIALSEIAFSTFASDDLRTGMGEARVREIARSALVKEVASDKIARRVSDELIDHCRGRAWIFTDIGLGRGGSDIFGFTHECFREYLAAVHVVRSSKSPSEIAERIVKIADAEQAEVLAQAAVSISQDNWEGGGSEVVLSLLKSSPSSRGRLLEFVARATDSTLMNRAALRALVHGLFDHSFTSQAWKTLLDRNYLHREVTHELIYEEWFEILESDPRQAASLASRYGWLWEIVVSADSDDTSDIVALLHGDAQDTFIRFFSGDLASMSRDFDVPTLFSRIVATVSGPSEGRTRCLNILATLAQRLDEIGCENFCGILQPSFSHILCSDLKSWADRLTLALQICATDSGVKSHSGMVYLAAGFVEIAESVGEHVTVNPVRDSDFGESRRSGRIPEMAGQVTPGCKAFLEAWAAKRSFVIFDQNFDQAVS
jgi:hypothetical protein